jgi:hypothetical protein
LSPPTTRRVTVEVFNPISTRDDLYSSQSHISTDSQGALSEEMTGLSFVHAASPCQRSLSRARVPWDSRPYFTVSDLRLPFSSPPTTRRVTVEVFYPASTRVALYSSNSLLVTAARRPVLKTRRRKIISHLLSSRLSRECYVNSVQRFDLHKRIHCCGNVF